MKNKAFIILSFLQLFACIKKQTQFNEYTLIYITLPPIKIKPNAKKFISKIENSKKIESIPIKSYYKFKAVLYNYKTNDTISLYILSNKFFYHNSQLYESREPLISNEEMNQLTILKSR